MATLIDKAIVNPITKNAGFPIAMPKGTPIPAPRAIPIPINVPMKWPFKVLLVSVFHDYIYYTQFVFMEANLFTDYYAFGFLRKRGGSFLL